MPCPERVCRQYALGHNWLKTTSVSVGASGHLNKNWWSNGPKTSKKNPSPHSSQAKSRKKWWEDPPLPCQVSSFDPPMWQGFTHIHSLHGISDQQTPERRVFGGNSWGNIEVSQQRPDAILSSIASTVPFVRFWSIFSHKAAMFRAMSRTISAPTPFPTMKKKTTNKTGRNCDQKTSQSRPHPRTPQGIDGKTHWGISLQWFFWGGFCSEKIQRNQRFLIA